MIYLYFVMNHAVTLTMSWHTIKSEAIWINQFMSREHIFFLSNMVDKYISNVQYALCQKVTILKQMGVKRP